MGRKKAEKTVSVKEKKVSKAPSFTWEEISHVRSTWNDNDATMRYVDIKDGNKKPRLTVKVAANILRHLQINPEAGDRFNIFFAKESPRHFLIIKSERGYRPQTTDKGRSWYFICAYSRAQFNLFEETRCGVKLLKDAVQLTLPDLN